jgi:sigma-B regulation protein RsbU (phosphoserine phosphatase)
MKILIAEDERSSRLMLESVLAEWGYQPLATADGLEACQILQAEDAPKMALLDWGMPGRDGLEVCRRVRAKPVSEPTYLILLTGRDSKADVVAGLQAGANDYVTKPFDSDELRARLQVGRQVVELQQSLAAQVRDLEAALAQVKRLEGMLPICSYCKKVRDDQNYWQQVETYLLDHSEVRFSHGICPECLERQLNAFDLRNPA